MTSERLVNLDGGQLEGELLQGVYYVEQKVGKGGMAWVYKASHIESGTPFALKVLFSQFSANEDVRRRFLREAAILQTLRHPHIVGMQDVLECNGLLGMVLEWCDGGDLKDWTSHVTPPLPLGQVQSIVLPLIEAVDHAHQVGYIHRDLKLQNVLLQQAATGDCIPKITDFGVAKALTASAVTQTGAMMGTLEFMSPEQLRDAKRIDSRADIYSLGVMIYYLCTGFYPFNGNQHQLIMQILSYEAPHPEGAPPELIPLIMKCLSKEPDSRFASCAELRDAWSEAVGHVASLPLPFVEVEREATSDGPATQSSEAGTTAPDEARTRVAPHRPAAPSSGRPLRWLLLFLSLLIVAGAAFWAWTYLL